MTGVGMRGGAAIVALLMAPGRYLPAQIADGRVVARVVHDSTPLGDALVRAGSARATTNAQGEAVLRLPVGVVTLIASRIGFRPDTAALAVNAGLDTTITFALIERPAAVAPVFVTSTRMERRLEEEPLRIEVLGGDDVGEKSEMRPADSRTLLTEMSGVRVQSRSPLGATNVRIQGLPGRYAAILSDGLPLFGGQASSFTLVDVVPLDLRQAEVIKGAASALYGPQALAGVVNLISRRPPDTSQVLVNQSVPAGTDAMAFLPSHLASSLGATLLVGLHQQRVEDGDRDGWADVPGLRRVEARPRLFYDDSAGHSLMVTAGGFAEDRAAGSVGLRPIGAPGPSVAFADSLTTRHADFGAIGRWRSSPAVSFGARVALSGERRRHQFGASTDRDDRTTAFGELTASRSDGANGLIVGAAAEREEYSSATAPQFDHVYATPALFVQDTYAPGGWWSGTANVRCDWSNVFGTICTPRLSLLARPAPALSARLSAGDGWFAPSALTDETETFSLSRVRIPQPLGAERGRSASLDVTAVHGPLEIDGTLFANRVASPVGIRRVADDTTGAVNVVNAAGPLTTHGGELFAVFNQEPFIITTYYAATRSREVSTETGRIRELPLTPRQTAGIDAALEDDESGAYGAVEVFYTGRQALEDDPYASVSRPYTTIGVLLSMRLGGATIFANGENLTNVRLARYQPLVRPAPGEGGRWTVDPWAPLEGRRVNLGLRWQW